MNDPLLKSEYLYNLKRTSTIKFSDISKPNMVCLIVANGGPTKLLQSYLDGHPQLYNIPCYPMIYYYPHWETWEINESSNWTWEKIIDLFCNKHSSLLDSRNIGGLNGLDRLGDNKNEHIEISEKLFRFYLKEMLKEEPIKRRTFLLAVYYVYAICKGQDLSNKTTLLWPHHVYEYLDIYFSDFPDSILIGSIRDSRPKIYRNYELNTKTDQYKLNPTDQMIYRSHIYYHVVKNMFYSHHKLKNYVNPSRAYFLKHEELAMDQKKTMQNFCRIIHIDFLNLLLDSTFDGKLWWGHRIYDMPISNENMKPKERVNLISKMALERVLLTDWNQYSSLEIFVIEGIAYDFFTKYNYDLLYYKKDTFIYRFILFLIILLPQSFELRDFIYYWSPINHKNFLVLAFKECRGIIPLKDYSKNASYIYKRNYKDFKLWEKSYSYRLFEKTKNFNYGSKYWFIIATIQNFGAVIYILGKYFHFLISAFLLPVQYCKRVLLHFSGLWKRLFNKTFWVQELT